MQLFRSHFGHPQGKEIALDSPEKFSAARKIFVAQLVYEIGLEIGAIANKE